MVLDDVGAGELLAGGQHELVELGFVEVLERGPHDVALGEEAGVGEAEQPGEQLPAGQVTGGPEQHDHVSVQGGRVVEVFGRGVVAGGEQIGVGDSAHGRSGVVAGIGLTPVTLARPGFESVSGMRGLCEPSHRSGHR